MIVEFIKSKKLTGVFRMKSILGFVFVALSAMTLSSCCCDRDPCCEQVPPRPRCCEPRPCCPKPCCPPRCEPRYYDNNCM